MKLMFVVTSNSSSSYSNSLSGSKNKKNQCRKSSSRKLCKINVLFLITFYKCFQIFYCRFNF